MKKLLSSAVLSLLSCATVQAQESLFIANVVRVTLEPRGSQYCPDRCAADGRPSPAGSTRVCIANDGGCEKAEFVVGRVLFGDMQAGPRTVDTRIGEWGGTHFPVTQAPILVHLKPGLVDWAPLAVRDGQQLVQVKKFRRGGIVSGLDLRSLAQGDDDGVTLDALAEHLSGRR